MLIFLGAGASVPFGPKPYSCIQSEVWELMQKYDVEELCRTAEEKMTSNGVVFDFEAILAMFEFLNDSGKGIQEAGPLLSWLKQDDYLNKIKKAGFKNIDIVKEDPVRITNYIGSDKVISEIASKMSKEEVKNIDEAIVSVKIAAIK